MSARQPGRLGPPETTWAQPERGRHPPRGTGLRDFPAAMVGRRTDILQNLELWPVSKNAAGKFNREPQRGSLTFAPCEDGLNAPA